MSTKKKKKTTKRKTKPKLIKPRGLGLSIKLFKFEDMNISPTQLANHFKGMPFKASKKNVSSGFFGVKSSGKKVSATFVSNYSVPVLSLNEDGDLVSSHYMTVDRAQVAVKMDKGTIEVRGSERMARRFKRVLEELTGAKIAPLNLNGGTKKIYDYATDISSVFVSGLQVDSSPLTAVEFHGTGIKTITEMSLYTRKYNGEIVRFRGKFNYPSGANLTTIVNALSGSIVVYKTGDGIPAKDVEWIVNLMEEAALQEEI